MRVGLVISSVMHAVLLLWALISFERHKPEIKLPPPEMVVTEIISESDLAKLRQGSRSAKLDEAVPKESPSKDTPKKEVQKPRPPVTPPPSAAEPPPPPPPKEVEAKPPEPAKPEPPKAEPPKPEPPKPQPDKAALDQKLEELAMQQAEEARKAEEAAKAKAAAEEARLKAEEKKKAAEKKRKELAEKRKLEAEKRKRDEAERLAKEKNKLNTDRLSELLNKAPDPKQAAPAAPVPTKQTQAKGPVKGAPEGRDQINSATRNSILAKLIWDTYSQNWDISCGSDGVDQIVVKVAVVLRPDGRLAQPPRVVSPMPGALFQLMADAALRAVVRADPVSFPPDLYKDGWDNFTAVFDARQRCGR